MEFLFLSLSITELRVSSIPVCWAGLVIVTSTAIEQFSM
jgi:hypothetical protein